MLAFKRDEQAFEGVAENAGFRTEGRDICPS
jgi:hypothetical protein